jgi:hypothetical protein
MSQTVRINAAYSEKNTADFNSQQYSVGLEMDAQINGSTREIEEASQKLFALCRRIVAQQKGVSVDNLLQSPAHNEPAPVTPPASSTNLPRMATSKQLLYLWKLGKRAGLTDEQVRGLPMQYYQKATADDLTGQEASSLIDSLTEKRKAA